MEPRALALFLAKVLNDRKAEDIVILDVENLVGYTSYFIVASGRSDRQVKALASTLEREVKTHLSARPLSREGVDQGNWALLDYGDAVVHVFRAEERDFYDLEGLWSDAPREDYPSATVATPAQAPAE